MDPLNISEIVSELEGHLSIPSTRDYSQTPPSIINSITNDASILSCGCLVSEGLANELSSKDNSLTCPVCHKEHVHLISPCKHIRSLSKYVLGLKDLIKYDDTNSHNGKSISNSRNGDIPNVSLLTAFNEAFAEVSSNGITKNQQHSYGSKEISTENSSYQDSRRIRGGGCGGEIAKSVMSSSPASNTTGCSVSFAPNQSVHSSFKPSNLTKLLTRSSNVDKQVSKLPGMVITEDSKELLYGKNFPFFKRLYQYHLHHSKFFPRSKLFISTSISQNLTRLALISEKKFEVYCMDPSKPGETPQLFCYGKNDGEYGRTYDQHLMVTKEDIVRNSNFADSPMESLNSLAKWEYISCKVTNNLLVISGTRGFLRIHDLSCGGRCIYTYQCKFPIRCIDVSPDEHFISIGVTGKDRYTWVEQAFVILLRLDFEDSNDVVSVTESASASMTSSSKAALSLFHQSSSPSKSISSSGDLLKIGHSLRLTAFPFNLPYRDPITILRFSPNSKLLSAATALESRFLTINVANPNRPVLVMKSQRKLDTSLDSEGITDIQFFPDNRTMSLTSVAYNSVPIIIDTNITSISGPEGIAKPKLQLKVDEVGSSIHRCCVSPRGDSVAYLDRSGTVYLMLCPQMRDNDNKRVVIVTDVANSFTARESANMKFDAPGYKLYILDRKGLLTIADFTAGTVEDQSVTRCKVIT